MVCGLLIQNVQEWSEQTGQSWGLGRQTPGGQPLGVQPAVPPLGQTALLDCADLKEKQKWNYLKNEEAHKSMLKAGVI